jgi:hypothetical protein
LEINANRRKGQISICCHAFDPIENIINTPVIPRFVFA